MAPDETPAAQSGAAAQSEPTAAADARGAAADNGGCGKDPAQRAEIAAEVSGIGVELLGRLGALVAEADPEQRVSPRNRALCAGLSVLASAAHEALGGDRGRVGEVREAAALLSLLTKIDDQVIDSPAFHHARRGEGGASLERRTRAYLAPTLRSLSEAKAASDEPRCRLAAELGARLSSLAVHPGRRRQVVGTIAHGWEVQVKAVSILSRHPDRASLPQVERITAQISGAWLTLMVAVGTLPARRFLTAAERRTLLRWGAWIQRADALSDFTKDTAELLLSSLPGKLLHQASPTAYLRACEAGAGPLLALLRQRRVDERLVASPRQLDRLCAELASLGQLPALLRWIHGFLTWRYTLAQPTFPRASEFAAFATTGAVFART